MSFKKGRRMTRAPVFCENLEFYSAQSGNPLIAVFRDCNVNTSLGLIQILSAPKGWHVEVVGPSLSNRWVENRGWMKTRNLDISTMSDDQKCHKISSAVMVKWPPMVAAMKRCSAALAAAMLRCCLAAVKDEVIREDTCLKPECGQNLVQKAVKTLKLGSEVMAQKPKTWEGRYKYSSILIQ